MFAELTKSKCCINQRISILQFLLLSSRAIYIHIIIRQAVDVKALRTIPLILNTEPIFEITIRLVTYRIQLLPVYDLVIQMEIHCIFLRFLIEKDF
jgi:hypothetical protein